MFDGSTAKETPSSPQSPSSLFSNSSSLDILLQQIVPVLKKQPSKSIKMPQCGTNPQTNLVTMFSAETGISRGISTKQCVAQGVLAPALPKDIVALTKNQSMPNLKKPVLTDLFIKKRKINDTSKPAIGGAFGPMQKEPSLASLNTPLVQSPSTSFISAGGSSTQSTQQSVNTQPLLSSATITMYVKYSGQSFVSISKFLFIVAHPL